MLEPPDLVGWFKHTLLALCWCVSCRFDVLEPPELVLKHPKQLALSVLVCFV